MCGWPDACPPDSDATRRRSAAATDESRDAGLGPANDLVVDLAYGQRDDRRPGPVAANLARGFDAVGHLEVDESNVRRSGQRVELAPCAVERRGATDDAEPRVAAKGTDDSVTVETHGHEYEHSDVRPQQLVPGI